MCGALVMAHRRGVVRGDVKPDNVLFDEYNEPQLCDFGIAELRHSPHVGARIGVPVTPAFAPPEVLDGGRPTPAADILPLR